MFIYAFYRKEERDKRKASGEETKAVSWSQISNGVWCQGIKLLPE